MTVPKRIRPFFLHDRALLGELCRIANDVICRFFRQALSRDDLRPGIICAVQTYGSLVNFNPHLHLLVSDGAFDAEGRFHPLPWREAKKLEAATKHLQRRALRLCVNRGLLQPEDMERMLKWKFPGFSIHNKVRVCAHERKGLEDLICYIARAPVALDRLHYDGSSNGDAKSVIYRSQHIHPGEGANFVATDPLEFLARLSDHIPDRGLKLIRSYGFYAAASRAHRKAAGSSLSAISMPEKEPSRCSSTWARLIHRIYGEDPLVCPKCGGRMKIISFITEAATIKQILDHVGIPSDPPQTSPSRAPPKMVQGEFEELEGFEIDTNDDLFPVDPPFSDDDFIDPPSDDDAVTYLQ